MSDIDVDESSTPTTTDSDESTDSSTTSSADAGAAPPRPAGPTGAAGGGNAVGGIELHHQPHDLEVAVDDGEHAETPRAHTNAAAAAVAQSAVSGGIQRDISGATAPTAAAAGGGAQLTNQPHDMAFNVEDDEDEEEEESDEDDDVHISVPASAAAAAAAAASAGARPTAAAGSISGAKSGPAGGAKSGTLANQVSDYFQDVEDDVDGEVSTPVRDASPTSAGSITPEQQQQRGYDAQQQQQQAQAAAAAAAQQLQQQRLQAQASGHMQPPPSSSDSDTATESDSDEGEGYSHASPGSATNASVAPSGGGLEYNPGDFAHLLPTLSQEVRDLFNYITDFKPVIPECPTKLIPFIPEYMPCIGDIDNFCKIPRPDGRADNLGLVALDEPSSTQTHPAVVKMQLAQILRVPPPDSAVTSIEDAANQPQKIDKWIADMKELQQKKPLPNVIYNGPMPDIESLLQVWPEGFEQILSSDIALPPPGIDLDIFQYVRLLCNLVDIPTSANLVESLHLMFSLYLEFRQNQHFQHA